MLYDELSVNRSRRHIQSCGLCEFSVQVIKHRADSGKAVKESLCSQKGPKVRGQGGNEGGRKASERR